MYYIYMLRCADDSLYTGITTDLSRRVAEHCAGRGARYTQSHRPVAIEAVWTAADRAEASRLEANIKALPRSKKLQLIAGALPLTTAARLPGPFSMPEPSDP